MTRLIVATLTGVVLSALFTTFLIRDLRQDTPRIAVIDVAGALGEADDRLTAEYLRQGATDSERQAAVERSKQRTERIAETVDAIAKECACYLFNKNYLVTTLQVRDYSEDLRTRLASVGFSKQ